MTTITRSELFSLIYRFYPRGMLHIAREHVSPGEPVYDDTVERRHLVEASNRGRAEYPTWQAMIRRLGDRYGLQNESLSLFSGGTDPAYSARIWLTRETAISFHVSLLGPYYGIHLPGIPEEEPVAREIAREIEATYPGYKTIPPELGNEVVPDVCAHGGWLGEATIYVCLFSDAWTWVYPDQAVPVTYPHELSHKKDNDSVKHAPDELLSIVYQHYPRGIESTTQFNAPPMHETQEHARLVAARRKAATDERFPSMLRRIQERFPDAPLTNHSLHLPTGNHDACYSFAISLPKSATKKSYEYHHLWFQLSFLAPYYIVFSSQFTERQIVRAPRGYIISFYGLPMEFPANAIDSGFLLKPEGEHWKSVTIKQRGLFVSFDCSPDEGSYAEWITREIEATFGCERLAPYVGTMLVSDVATESRRLGEARLYDCLFSDTHPWVQPVEPEMRAPAVEIDAHYLTEKGTAVVTVLAALFHILRALLSHQRGGAVHVDIAPDGVLRKEAIEHLLAWMRSLIDSAITPFSVEERGKLEAAMGEFDTLVRVWDDNGAPSEAMVAWAASFLANGEGGAWGEAKTRSSAS